MGEVLDQVARTIAAGGSRRAVLKRIGGAVAGALLVSLGLGAKPAAADGCRPCGSSGAPCCGCCSGTTGSSCAAGTSNSLCGVNGQRCVVCPKNTRCNGGACTCCPVDQPNCGIICAVGQPCTANGTCGACTNPVGGFPCNGVCKLPSGATCSSHAQCASGICSTGSPRTCIGEATCGCPGAFSCNSCTFTPCGTGDCLVVETPSGTCACIQDGPGSCEFNCSSGADCDAHFGVTGLVCVSASKAGCVCNGQNFCTAACGTGPVRPTRRRTPSRNSPQLRHWC